MFLFIDDNEEMRSGGFTAVHGGEEMRKERRKVVRVCITQLPLFQASSNYNFITY